MRKWFVYLAVTAVIGAVTTAVTAWVKQSPVVLSGLLGAAVAAALLVVAGWREYKLDNKDKS
jgi:hypothetical protein